MDVRALMAQAVRSNGNRLAIIHGECRLTFDQAWLRGIRLANALLALGLRGGDRVATLEDNCIEAADLIQACAIANLVRVPLYARNAAEAHRHMLANTQCRVVVACESYRAVVEEATIGLPDLARVIIRDAGYEDWLASHSGGLPDVTIDPDDIYIIRHTGGTTGRARAVAYSHRSWLAACRDWFYIFPQVQQGDRCLHVGPISHASGYQYLPVWLAGGCNVLVDHFDPDQTVELIERERIAYCQVVGAMLRAILDLPGAGNCDFSSLKCVLVGAAPVQEKTALEARDLLGDVLYQGYGLTEALPVAFMGPEQWFSAVEGSTPLRACGMVMPFSLVEIWDEDNRPLPIGETGEIVAKTDGQMTGFWNNPEATAERIVDGWIKSGDIGRLDANGYLYLLDRADNMIISGGYNIWPLELERVIEAHPEVLEVAVFGVPHPRWGETPVAICVVRAEARVTEQELIAQVAGELGSYIKPSKVIFQTQPLARSAVGKIDRKTMREPYWAGVERRIAGS
jgi:acyl-CoA synthetase (AMP-forming)/AMP-acid ligase II